MRSQEPYANLPVWHDSLEFVKEIYLLTNLLPEEEKAGLYQRMRNAAIEAVVHLSKFFTSKHMPASLASVKDAYHHLNELEILLRICHTLGYINQDDVEEYTGKVAEMNRQVSLLVRKIEREKELESDES